MTASRSAPQLPCGKSFATSASISDYGLLADAAAVVASPQIRNVGTLGGNLVQDARCWYYRRGPVLLSRWAAIPVMRTPRMA